MCQLLRERLKKQLFRDLSLNVGLVSSNRVTLLKRTEINDIVIRIVQV